MNNKQEITFQGQIKLCWNTQSAKVYYFTVILQVEIVMYMAQMELVQNKPMVVLLIIL